MICPLHYQKPRNRTCTLPNCYSVDSLVTSWCCSTTAAAALRTSALRTSLALLPPQPNDLMTSKYSYQDLLQTHRIKPTHTSLHCLRHQQQMASRPARLTQDVGNARNAAANWCSMVHTTPDLRPPMVACIAPGSIQSHVLWGQSAEGGHCCRLACCGSIMQNTKASPTQQRAQHGFAQCCMARQCNMQLLQEMLGNLATENCWQACCCCPCTADAFHSLFLWSFYATPTFGVFGFRD